MPSKVISVQDLQLDNTIKQDTTSTTDYFSDNGIMHTDFIQSGNTVKFTSKGRTITWVPQNMRYLDADGMDDTIYSVQDVPLETKANYARFNRTMPDIDDWFIVENDQVKHQILVQGFQRDPAPYLSDPIQFAIGGQLLFDADLTVRSMGMTLVGAFQTADAISICDGDEVIFTLPVIVAYDSKIPERAQTTGMYNVTTNAAGNLQFDIVVDNSWISDVERVYPIVIDPTVIVSNAYDTSGNGGRKIVRLSNNWIVTVASSTSYIYFFVSKDNGATWSQLTYISAGQTVNSVAMASKGTMIYVLYSGTGFGNVYFNSFDATTITNTQQAYKGQYADGTAKNAAGCTLEIDGAGVLHAAWAAKTTTYANSWNIRYNKSTDGGNTWTAPTQLTTANTSGVDYTNPCLVVRSNNLPTIIIQYAQPSTNTYILYTKTFDGTSWNIKSMYSDSYAQSNPCAAVDNNDVIHAVWHGLDSTDTSINNIRYSKSTDGGTTWSTMLKLTSGNTYHQMAPSISIDPNNNLYVFFNGTDATYNGAYFNIRKVTFNGSWSAASNVTTNTSSADIKNPQTLWSKFNINSSDAVRYVYQDTANNAVKYDSITLNSPPNAPTLNAHSNFDATTAQTLTWTFSDPDSGNTQSAYELQIVDTSNNSVVVDTGKVASTTSSYSLAANTLTNGKTYQWRVTTWDNSGAQGPWSTYSTFSTAAAPTVTITSPTAGSTDSTSSVTVQFSYSDPANNAQQSYQVQLLDSTDASVLSDSGTINGTNNAYTVQYTLANSTTYHVRARATNSQGVTSAWNDVSFSTSFTQPATPSLAVTPNNSYMALTITDPAPSGSQPTVSSHDVYRRKTGDTTWCRIATGIANNGAYTDYAIASGQSYEYKVTAYGSNGTTVDSAVDTNNVVNLAGVWIHDPSNPSGTIYQFRIDGAGRSAEHDYDATLMQFEGRQFPVADYAVSESQNVKVKLSMLKDSLDLPTLRSLIARKSTLLYRDGRGRKMYGVITALPETDERGWGYTVDVQINAVDYQEAV